MGATVLLADGVTAYRTMVASKLRRMGAEVIEAEDSAAAIQALQSYPIDVAIVDNDLVQRSTLDLLQLLTSQEKRTRVILVVDPSFDMGGAEAFRAETGVTLVLSGPVHPRTLMEHVEQLVGPVGTPETEAAPATPGPEPGARRGADRAPLELDESLQQHLASVRNAYRQKLPGELAKLEAALESATSAPGETASLREAHRLAHTLHGTSGTLGFAEISAVTGEIEIALKRALAGEALDAAAWRSFLDGLARAQATPDRTSALDSLAPSPSFSNCVATLLVADSDREMMAAAKDLAKKNLIHIVPVDSEGAFLEKARAKRLDGALIDIDFGGPGNAFKIMRELRSVDGFGHLPIGVMSGDSSVQNRVAATHAGASQFLQKPLTADQMVEVARYFTAVTENVHSRVLIVDDDDIFAAHIEAILRSEGMEVTYLEEPERILQVIEQAKPDILLLDVMMPKISGFEVCRMLRSTTAWKEIPILFLTAESSPDVRLECFRAGGDDYIEKPVVREELLARIGVRLERIRLFREKADRDGLTNLPNRRAFIDLFKLRIAEGERYNSPVSLCLIDLDHFKQINDHYGHLAGDQVLVGLGRLLSSRFRAVDVRGRWGGEEFTVVFYGEDAETSRMILTRMLKEFRSLTFEGDHGERFSVTFSCGIATFPRDGETFDALFRAADERLYGAKEAGRNCIRI